MRIPQYLQPQHYNSHPQSSPKNLNQNYNIAQIMTEIQLEDDDVQIIEPLPIVGQMTQISTLLEIEEYLTKHKYAYAYCSVFGVVVEATSPIFRSKSNTYVTRLKIVDNTTEVEEENGVKKVKYCNLFLMEKEKRRIRVTEVGAVVFVERFAFEKQTERLRASISCQGGKFEIYDSRNLTNELPDQVNFLRKWASQQLSNLFCPNLGVRILDQRIVQVSKFNMVLRIVQAYQSKLQSMTSFFLVDTYKNSFSFSFENSAQYKSGTMVLITHIKHIDSNMTIHIGELGNMMTVPKECWERSSVSKINYLALFNEDYKCRLQYAQGNYMPHRLSTVKSKVFEAQNKTTITPAITLYEACNSHKHSSSESTKLQSKFILDVFIVSCHGRARLFDHSLKLFSDVEFQLQYGPNFSLETFKYIYEIKFQVKDPSMTKHPNLLSIYLFSYDDVGKKFFPDIDLDFFNRNIQKYGKDLELRKKDEKEIKHQIQKWFKYLQEKSGFDDLLRVAVEPLIHKDRLVFRIIDTELNPMQLEPS